MERFWSKVAVAGPSECWLWTAGCNRRSGRGQSSINGVSMPAPRVSWILTNGPIPLGQEVLHKCDNPPCVNPAHLFLGTQQDNVDDAIAKGRRVAWCGGSTPLAVRIPNALLAEVKAAAGDCGMSLYEWWRNALRVEVGVKLTYDVGYEEGKMAGWADAQARLREALKGA